MLSPGRWRAQQTDTLWPEVCSRPTAAARSAPCSLHQAPHPVTGGGPPSHGVTVYGAKLPAATAQMIRQDRAIVAVGPSSPVAGLVSTDSPASTDGPLRPDAATLIAPLVAAGEQGERPPRRRRRPCPAGRRRRRHHRGAPSAIPQTAPSPSPASRGACVYLRPRHLCGAVEVVPSGCPRPQATPLPADPSTGPGDYLIRALPEPGTGDHRVHPRRRRPVNGCSETYQCVRPDPTSGTDFARRAGMVAWLPPDVWRTSSGGPPGSSAERNQALVLGPGIDRQRRQGFDELRAVTAPRSSAPLNAAADRDDGASGNSATGTTSRWAARRRRRRALSLLMSSWPRALTYAPLPRLTPPHAGGEPAATPDGAGGPWRHRRRLPMGGTTRARRGPPARAVRELSRLLWWLSSCSRRHNASSAPDRLVHFTWTADQLDGDRGEQGRC